MNSLLLILTIFLFGSFLWAGIFYFKRPPKKNALFLATNIIGFATIILNSYLLVSSQALAIFYILGFIFLVLSCLVFWWAIWTTRRVTMNFAFFGEKESRVVIKEGPYKWIRHPFYSSYILGWFGLPLIHGYYLALIFALVMVALYMKASIYEENSYDESSLSEEYRAYKEKTGRFIPKILL